MTNASTSPEDAWKPAGPGDRRGPCPALNALANGGDLPHDGEATHEELVGAMWRRLGVSPSVGSALARAALARLGRPRVGRGTVLDLSDLSLKTGLIEHDASLTRRDARCGDAAELVPPLLTQLLERSADGRVLTLDDLAVAHQLRVAQCEGHGHRLPLKASLLGTLEAALLYRVLARGDGIALADAQELFSREHVPPGVERREIGWFSILTAAFAVAVVGNVPLFEAARRARRAAKEIPEPEAARCQARERGSRAAGSPSNK
jgi:hypothetical protein